MWNSVALCNQRSRADYWHHHDNNLRCPDRCVLMFNDELSFIALASPTFDCSHDKKTSTWTFNLSDYSLRQVITSGKRANVNSYETLMEATFGRPGFVFLSLNMFFLSYGAMLAYLTIIKDVLPILFGVAPDDEYTKRGILVISSLIIILPLSMQRDMADLEKTSRLNVFLNLALVGIVTGYSPVFEKVEMEGGLLEVIQQEMVFDTKRFFVGFGVASFAFVSE